MARQPIADLALFLIATIAVIGAFKFAQSLLAPITLGLVLAVVLAPIVRHLTLAGVPRAACAFGALLAAGVVIVIVLVALGPVIAEFISQIPRLQFKALQTVQAIADSLGIGAGMMIELQSVDGDEAVAAAMPSLVSALWFAPNFFAQLLIFAGTLFFFLLTRDDVYDALPQSTAALTRADRAVSHYFVTITLINAGLGAAVFGAMTLYGLPNPVIWGMAAFLLNFVLYLGPISLILALLVVGSIQFSGLMVLAPALTFFAMNLTEAQFVTPTLVGQRMRLNPLGVFFAILFGLWLWGPIGGIVALPVLVWVTAFFRPAPDAEPKARTAAVPAE